ncbi:MAG: hypothetical protein WBS24_05320 [Terriglobales bacterium]
MWIKKLLAGVLELDTSIGTRYLEPSLVQRARLLWTFRNFSSLPHQVLRPSELQLIDCLLEENRSISKRTLAADDRPIIGRVEGRVERPEPAEPGESLPMRKPATSAVNDQSREAAA